ncbi:aldose 1-epimerase [Maribacter sedimenticola]|uniref:Aldose 1-epimerase n=2 Tax=Maribacter sedimenticola TaxID=228956 RepID=A0ABY1SF13_9FLAO|nr:aldose 1-epimerase [Maribacter sedimenticola]
MPMRHIIIYLKTTYDKPYIMRPIIKISYLFVLISIIVCNVNCKEKTMKTDHKNDDETTSNPITISKADYGVTKIGDEVEEFTLSNKEGIEVAIITYGGRITSIKAADKEGRKENVVLGFDNLAQYEENNPFFGALIGRYGNRIAKGKFSLNDTEYTLAKNNGENNLHGGLVGFDKVVWTVEGTQVNESSASLKLSYLSKDMEEGFPGNVNTTVTYTLNADNSLDVLYEATTDKTTIVNLTQHSYFNLSGDFSQLILDHEVEIDADQFVPVDGSLIPTGKLASVDGTPFDFRTAKLVSEGINAENEQIALGGGYDHCWALNNVDKGYRSVATAHHPETGRTIEVLTDQPGMQFYSGNFLDGTLPSPDGGTYAKRSGFCLETQHYPDSPNQPNFPAVTLTPDDKYKTKTTFKFYTK